MTFKPGIILQRSTVGKRLPVQAPLTDAGIGGGSRQAAEVYRFGRRGSGFWASKLLAVFVKRAGRVLSRAQLLDEVWGGTNVTDRVVDNQVTNLRRKIEPDPEHPRYLVALRGLG